MPRSLVRTILRLAVLTAFVCMYGRPVSAADVPTIRVVLVPAEGDADMYYAKDTGFFRDAGLDVQIDTIAAGQNIVVAVSGRSYDVGVSTTVAIALARQRGVPIRAISGGNLHLTAAPTDMLMVAQTSPIRTAHDLEGKTIGVTGLGNVPYLATQTWLRKNGVDLTAIKFVEVPYPAMAAALQAGRIDAAMMAEPYVTLSKPAARALSNAYDAISPRFMISEWFASDAWLAERPDVARRFVDALRKAHDWANAHQKETGEILVRYTRIDPAVVPRMVRTTFMSTPDAQLLQPVLDAALSAGMLPRPMTAAEMIWPAR
jgi:NitT/TauT family transport system substrate-binding protein